MTNNIPPTQLTFQQAEYELTQRIRDEVDGFMGDMQFDPAIDRQKLVDDIKADLDLWVRYGKSPSTR